MRSCPARQRRGIEVLQLVLVMPLLFLTLLGSLQFASVISVENNLEAAAHEIARLASMNCRPSQIQQRADEYLAVHALVLGAGVRVVIIDSTGPTLSLGDETLISGRLNERPPENMVRSVLIVNTDVTPIPNLLANFCVDFSSRQYEACGLSRRLCTACEL